MKKIISVFLSFIFALALSAAAVQAKPEENSIMLTGVCDLVSGETIQWQFAYSDLFFENDPAVYDHLLARASLGLAISSFRTNKENKYSQDIRVRNYLTDAGFDDLLAEGYDEATGEHTVSTMIASKRLDGFTLIAAVPCGGGYEDEWLSNFNVGTVNRHEGFQEAAQIVEERLTNYIKDHEITGDIRLWMAGYSRGAAIANLVEADMTDSGQFTAVYGYNFAVPKNTKDEKNYTNIFNIIGKYDPVTMIPLSEWGYLRYGTDLYTPAQEMDSDYADSKLLANEVSKKLLGKSFRNNPGVNGQLHMLLEYLLQILPTDETYEVSLKDAIKNAWVNMGNVNALFEIIENALSNMQSLDAAQQANVNNMITFIETILTTHLQGNTSEIKNGYWDSNETLASNIIHEHSPEVYLEWMFSSENPEEIFGDNAITNRVIITGSVQVDIYDESGFKETIYANGDIETDEKNSMANLYAVRNGSQTILSLPGDQVYKLLIYANKNENLGYLKTLYNTGEVTGESSHLVGFKAMKDDTFVLTVDPSLEEIGIQTENGDEVDTWESDLTYSPAMIMQIENVNVFHISISSLILIVACVTGFIVLLIILVILLAVIHAVLCRRRGRPYSKYFVIIPHLLLILLFFAITESVGYTMPVIKIVPPLFATLGTILMLLLCIRGNIRHKCKRNTIILCLLAICTVSCPFLMYYTGIGVVTIWQFVFLIIYFAGGSVAAVYTFPHEGHIKIQ